MFPGPSVFIDADEYAHLLKLRVAFWREAYKRAMLGRLPRNMDFRMELWDELLHAQDTEAILIYNQQRLDF